MRGTASAALISWSARSEFPRGSSSTNSDDGDVGTCWWFAVGTVQVYTGGASGNGIPAVNASSSGTIMTDRLRFWARASCSANCQFGCDSGTGLCLPDPGPGNNG